MKFLSALVFVTVLAIPATAQRAQNNTDEKLAARNAPDVFIYRASAFGPDKNGNSNFTIEVGNIGARTITGIEWEYYPSGDTVKQSGSIFRDTLRLRPDQRISLNQQIHRYTDSLVAGFHLDTVRILRVEYEDGSSWRRFADH